MNTRLLPMAALAATLSASAFSPMSAAQQSSSALGYWASRITVSTWDPLAQTTQTRSITAGTTRATVLALLGRPLQQLTPDVYLYDNCRADQPVARDHGCSTLVVTFSKDQVAGLKFVNPGATTIIAANARGATEQNAGSSAAMGKAHDVSLPNR
jgi:outer membrane protein assembly factor BamE (lipoprotein component of BamABCDE complex)